MKIIEELKIEKIKIRFQGKIKCKNCKFRREDDVKGKKIPYCYPRSLMFCTVPCETRYKNHYEQCLHLNGKITFDEMMGSTMPRER